MRRDVVDSILAGPTEANDKILTSYAVFKPNVLDGMDKSYVGRTGSTATGQYAMAYTTENGKLEARTTSNVEDAMAFMNDPSAKKDRVENPFMRTVKGKDTIVYRMIVPILNPRTSEVVGVVGMVLDIGFIQDELVAAIAENEEISTMAVYAETGLILASYRSERVGKLLKDVDTGYGEQINKIAAIVRDGEDYFLINYVAAMDDNLAMTLRSFEIGNSGYTWTVMIGSSESYIEAEVKQITMFAIILAAIFILATGVIVFLVVSGLTRPIVTVTDNLKDIAQGEGDLTRTIGIKSKDETGELAIYFNQTLEKIRRLVVIIKQQAVNLFNIGNELSANMTETASAINEINANIQSIKDRVLNQSASVTETNATMESITFNIEKLKENVDNQAASVTQSSAAIEEMLANIKSVTQTLVRNAGNVKELYSASKAGRTGLSEVAEDIREISRESEGLLEINSVMENIASQTNLLSMNAAIEAAHAGEAGKGFAVVADEIRKLAENSSAQSKTISKVLKKIKGCIDKINISTDKVLKRFEVIDSSVRTVSDQEENIRNAMEEQTEGSKQILEAISQLNEITQRVRNESVVMHEGSKEVIHEGKHLEVVTQEITGGMNEMAAGANQINIAVNEVNDISIKNKESISLLVKEVSRFKVE
jgi:methyl-accepting chemotaxis protein